ncbi:hypothetical protein DSM106972_030590 [Dulcicalothrix desertica PCC 7102]|uniref:Uncharacterized protein n=1 Tax=Dulcicalothrix desertica PCC 7102 TaxID=232991 RepID=A0A3S1AQS0_9CYAN|nr:hypothetical protein [Dulcicalothrix desertica]RUT06802.1 hypothetical protein DSM106972_030590 [Dulcicalothrix desertica PCC 7102]TWH50086.1 hypothetical protein CAL7102_04370 [Dulcicalothrix desertica PCC 7102]
MKTESERKEIINTINELLEQAYDSTLDEILSYLQKIDDIEDGEVLIAVKEAKEDIQINETVTWDEYKNCETF